MALAITSFTPANADSAGGTLVTITGTQLDTAEAFLVGTKSAQIVGTPSATTAVIRVPSGTGAVKIFAVDEAGPTTVASATNLTYVGVAPGVPAATTLAAKWAFEIDTSVAQDGSTWTKVKGLNNFQPALAETTQDDSDYDDYDPETNMSWGSDVKTQLKWSAVATLARKKVIGSGAYDAGQEALRAAHDLGADVGGTVHVRWYDRTGGPEAYEGYGTVTWQENGGKNSDDSTVGCTVMGRGRRLAITNPAAA